MRLQYIKSACVVVEHEGTRILCDPWLTDGIYYGSWYHYPPLRYKPSDFSNVDYIYISHIHPDHMDVETLKQLPRTIPILIHDYEDKFVQRILTQLGFRVIEVAHQSRYDLSPNLSIRILAADNCDPQVCGRVIGCQMPTTATRTLQIDSLAVFQTKDGETLVNTNDCPYALSTSVCDDLVSNIDRVDLLLVGYGGAGPYPQCFDNLSLETKQEKAKSKQNQFLRQTLQYLQHLKPAHFMPFAGQYVLGGKFAGLNSLRGVPDLEDLPELLTPMLTQNGVSSRMILLNSGERFDLSNASASAAFTPVDRQERMNYIQTVLSHKKLSYEKDHFVPQKHRTDLTGRLSQAQQRMQRHQERLAYKSDWRIYLDCEQSHLYCIPLNGEPVQKTDKGAEQEPFLRIRLDYSLLDMILSRKAHWNNAEVGSHLFFHRQPDVYLPALQTILCYLHC